MVFDRDLLIRPGLLAGAVSAVLLALPAQATVVLDTFGPGDTANGPRWSIDNPSPAGGGQSLAVPFTLTEAFNVDDILAAIRGTGSFSLGIVAGAELPAGSFVYSTTLVLNEPSGNVSLNGLGWALQAGNYWLVSKAQASQGGTFGEWRGGGSSATPWAFTVDAVDTGWIFSGTSDAPAARITVSAIPEPGTWALMLGGLALCAAAVRRRQPD